MTTITRRMLGASAESKEMGRLIEVADNSWLQILLDGRSIRGRKPGSF
jgi:hypothetical protein